MQSCLLALALAVVACGRQPVPTTPTHDAGRAPVPSRSDHPAALELASSRDASRAQVAPRSPVEDDRASSTPDTSIVAFVRREIEDIDGLAQHRIAVASERGVVTLFGTAATPLARSLLVQRVLALRGVRAVVNRLDVVNDEATDRQIAALVERRLAYDPITAHQALRVSVEHGVVRLQGSLRGAAERDLVTAATLAVPGVRAVENEIVLTVVENVSDDAIAEEAAQRLARDARLVGAQIGVRATGGFVFLSGEVKSEFERRAAREAAWGPGVRAVYAADVNVVRTREHLRDPANGTPEDSAITRALIDALHVDPRLGASALEVSTHEGRVVLEGWVQAEESRAAAEQNARNTFGAREVDNRIRVESRREVSDKVLSRRVGDRLSKHPGITPEGIQVFVNDGWVLLSGDADSAYERSRAEGTSASVQGVLGVVNRLQVRPDREWVVRDDAAIRRDVERGLASDPRLTPAVLRAGRVRFEVRDGVVTLEGRLRDYATHDALLENVFEALPRGVDNRLEVVENGGVSDAFLGEQRER